MAAMMQTLIGEGRATKWVPWLLLGALVLYMAGYVDSSVHAAAIGSPAILGPSTSSSITPATLRLCATSPRGV